MNILYKMGYCLYECKKYVPEVMLAVVDVIGKDNAAESKSLCEGIGIPLRVCEYIDRY